MIVRIKEATRELKKWSLYRLAKELGLPQQTVYSWANGRTQPNYFHQDLICTALGCTLNDLYKPERIELPKKVYTQH